MTDETTASCSMSRAAKISSLAGLPLLSLFVRSFARPFCTSAPHDAPLHELVGQSRRPRRLARARGPSRVLRRAGRRRGGREEVRCLARRFRMAPRDRPTRALPHAPSHRRPRRRVVRPRRRDPDVRAAATDPDRVARARSHRARPPASTPAIPAVGGTGPTSTSAPNRHPSPLSPAAPDPKPRRRREPSRPRTSRRAPARPRHPRISPPRHPRGDDHHVHPSPALRGAARRHANQSRDSGTRAGDARVERGRDGRRVCWRAARRG